MADRSVSVSLIARVQGFTAGIATAKESVQEFSGELDRLAKGHKEKFNQLALSAGVTGLALSAGFGLAVNAAMSFDKQMSEVGAVSDATGKSLEQLRQAALKAGKDTQYSATEAAAAEAELAKAGVSTADILGGGLTGALSLAAAGQMDLAEASTIAAQAMNIFGLTGSDVGHIADVLAAAANKSAADMGTLGDALKQGGLVAHQAGLSLEDTTGVLAAFADRGLQGSDAGTSLKTMLQQLQAPSAKSAALMKELGINAYDASGKFIGITALADQLQKQLGGLTQAQRDAAMAQIFGSDATRAATVLYNQGASGIQGYIDAVDDVGAANRTAAEKMNNLAGDVEQLKGTLETLAITSGEGASSGLRLLTQAANGALGQFMDLPPWIQTTATLLTGISGGGLLAATGFVKVRQAGKDFLDTLKEMGPTGEKAAGALGAISKWAGIAGGTVAAAVLVVEGIKLAMDKWNESSKPVARDTEQLSAALLRFASNGKIVGEMAKVTSGNLQQWATSLAQVRTDMYWAQVTRNADKQRELAKAFNTSTTDINAMDDALADLAKNGQATQAAIAFNRIRDSLVAAGIPLDEVNAAFGDYTKAASDAGVASSGLAQGFGTVADNARSLADSLESAIEKGQSLTDVWNQLNGALLNSDKAALAANQAIENVSDAIKKNGKVVDGNTDAALANRIAVGEAAEQAAKAAQARYEETGNVADAAKVYQDYIEALRKVMHQAGLTDTQINELLQDYTQMPASVTTGIVVNGVDTALNKITSITRGLNALADRTVTTTIYVDNKTGQTKSKTTTGPAFRRWGGVDIHAANGSLREAGTYSAMNPARYAFAEPATGGEAFVPRYGSYGRSMSILGTAARWYGASVVPGGGAAGGGVIQIRLHLAGGGSDLARAVMGSIRAEIQGPYRGNVQLALGGN